jgi:hypothetical protein
MVPFLCNKKIVEMEAKLNLPLQVYNSLILTKNRQSGIDRAENAET